MSIIKWNAASVYYKAGILIGTILILTGCAVEPHRGLEEARQNLNRAKQDQVVAEHAPVALYDAEKTITKAEDAWMEDDDEDYANHMAYMANQQIKIAEEKARQKAAQLEFSRLSDETQQLQLQARTQELEALKAQKTDRGMLITMGDVLFETGKADLKPGALQNLYRLATFLRENSSRNVLIEGHTDSVGSKHNNQLLSERRAHSVATFLMNNGVDSTRITDVGYGEDYPVDTNSTPAGRRNNRRVEVIVLNEGEPPRLRR